MTEAGASGPYRRVVIALTMEVPDGCGLIVNQKLADDVAAEVSAETGLTVEGLLAPKVGVFDANREFLGFALLDDTDAKGHKAP